MPTVVPHPISPIAACRSLGERVLALIGELPRQVHLALGIKGVSWAAAAFIIGLGSCVGALVDVAVSLKRSDVEYRKAQDLEVLELDDSYRQWLGRIVSLSAGNEAGDALAQSRILWARFETAFTSTCAGLAPAEAHPRLAALCRTPGHERLMQLKAAAEDAIREQRRVSPEMLRALLGLRDRINAISTDSNRAINALLGRVLDEHERAVLVLLVSTFGFVGAGFVLMLLIGHASIRHHAQKEAAETSAAEAGRSVQILRETLETLPAGVVLYDEADRLMLFNSMAASITPILTPDTIGKTYAELVEIHWEHRTRTSSAEAHENPTDWISNFKRGDARRLRRVDGDRWFEWSERRTPSGRTVGLRTDVTALKEHELEIERMRDEYQSLVAALSDVVFRLDLKSGKFTFVSAAARTMFVRPLSTLTHGHLLDFVSPADTERMRQLAREEYAAPDHTIREVRFRIRTGSGEEKAVEARFRRMPGEGAPVVAGVLRDVEAQTWLAERLEAERARLRSIVESSGALVLLADRDLSIVMVNSGFVDMTGIARDSAIGRPLGEMVDWPLDAEQFENWRHGRWAENDLTTVQLACRHIDPTGRERILSVTAKPILGETGEAEQFVFVGVDDTERREAEQALFATERLAAVGEMSAAVAHEIAQPLQVINLACHSALDELGEHTDPKAFDVAYIRQKLERIAGQIERSNRIVGDLRAFVRGTSADELHPFDPAEAVRSAVDLTAHGLQQARVKLAVSVEEGESRVMGHVSKLEQVLVNLINNAKDAGGSDVEITLRTERQDGADKVRITVQDSGPGISPEVLHHLFNAFITTKPRGGGTGLGLRVCRRIVEEMRGTIAGSNRAEGGARFEVVLPVAAD